MTGACRWDGRPPDYSAAIDGLLAVAARDRDSDDDDADADDKARSERHAQDDYLAELLARSAARSRMP